MIFIDNAFSVRILCWRCDGNVTSNSSEYLEKMIQWPDLQEYPLENGLQLTQCKDKEEMGNRAECPHKYTKCYKATISCYTSEEKKQDLFFRGCGGYAKLGYEVIKGADKNRMINKKLNAENDAYVPGDHVEMHLPNSLFPSITTYLAKKGCLKRNHTDEAKIDGQFFHGESGKIHLCDRVFCNPGQIVSPNLYLTIFLSTVVYIKYT